MRRKYNLGKGNLDDGFFGAVYNLVRFFNSGMRNSGIELDESKKKLI